MKERWIKNNKEKRAFFDRVEGVSTLSLGGGEP
jgi:hypothetical protein